MGGNPYLGTFVDLTADPTALIGGSAPAKGLSRALALAKKKRAISAAVPAYGKIVKKLPTYGGAVKGWLDDVVRGAGRAVNEIPGVFAADMAEQGGRNVMAQTNRGIMQRLRDVANIDIPYVPQTVNEPLVVKTAAKNISPITEALGKGATKATGLFAPLVGPNIRQMLPEMRGLNFGGDVILGARARTPEILKTLRHEGGHWAEDLMTAASTKGARPMSQHRLAMEFTGLPGNEATGILERTWSSLKEPIQDIYKRGWGQRSPQRYAREFFADIADPELSGLMYRTRKPYPQVNRFVRGLEGREPGLAKMREFAASKYDPRWEQVTPGTGFLTPPTSLPGNLYDMLMQQGQGQ
jgi:hypothetical protein